MPVRRFFDWSSPLFPALADHILPAAGDGPLEMGDRFFIAPTRQAGRRLREFLTTEWRNRGGRGLLSLEVHPPSFLLQPGPDLSVAHDFDWRTAWADVLTGWDPAELPNLLPDAEQSFTHASALSFGERVQRLRNELFEAGLDLAGVADRPILESEQERWRDLATVEAAYRQRLQEIGKTDPVDAKREALETFLPPDNVKQIVLVAVPDPSPVILRRFQDLEDAHNGLFEVWVHAPESERTAFDDWGRPGPEWRERFLGPDTLPAGWLESVPDPSALGDRILSMFRDAPEDPDVATGLLDDDLAPVVQHALESVDRTLYQPAPHQLSESPAVRLLEAFHDQRVHNDAQSLRALWRQPELLATLAPEDPAGLLAQWDAYAAEAVPDCAQAVEDTVPSGPLKEAWSQLRAWIDADSPLEQLECLQTVYQARTLNPAVPEDRYAERQLTAVSDLLQEAARREKEGQPPHPGILLSTLRNETVDPPRVEGTLTAEGWLELSTHPAPTLLLIGLHEGRVPAHTPPDPFLPNQLREDLGLRGDRDWRGRDAYLFHTLLMSRDPGAVRVLVLKRDRDGGPVLPSRLLFACPDETMLDRAELLFGEPPPPPPQPSPSLGVTLHPENIAASPITRLSVSQVSSYLTCPTRFYLSHVLKMRSTRDTALEPDAAAFGNLVHRVLERLVRQGPGIADDWAEATESEVQSIMRETYGTGKSMSLRVMAHAASVRIKAAGREQKKLWDAGWQSILFEEKVERTCHGLTISGILDRVDVHPDHGFRILDYKTTDQPDPPGKIHLGVARGDRPECEVDVNGKTRQWRNLQLPLYRWLAEEIAEVDTSRPLEVGYFLLPKSVSKTTIEIWKEESALTKEAEQCLETVVDHVRRGIWLPAAEGLRYDDFEPLLRHGTDWIPSETSA